MRKVGSIIDNLRSGQKAPDRHENPYLTEALELKDVLYTLEEIKEKKNNLYENSSLPLVVEIGCYMGKNVLEMAQQNLDKNFLGIDITYKRVVKSARKLKRNNFKNGKILIADGHLFLESIVPDNSLHGICVFFPDPWPKDRHEKNRLLKQEFVDLMLRKLSPNGFFWFKTDHQIYYKETEKKVLAAGFIPDDNEDLSPLLQPRSIVGGPYITAFQKLFVEKGVPYYQRVFLKNRNF